MSSGGFKWGIASIYLYHRASFDSWGIGASTALRYTPDALWCSNSKTYYTLVGDLTNSGLRCGSSSSDLLHPAGYVHSGFGASFYMQYT